MSETLLVVLFLLLILMIAGRAQTSPVMRRALFFLLTLINIGIILTGVPPVEGDAQPALPPERARLAFVIAIGFASAAFALMLPPVRRALKRFFTPAFSPDSIPQMVALIFCVYMLANTVMSFILSGGLSGLAAEFEGVSVTNLFVIPLIFVSISLVGAGFPLRRGWSATWYRLGVRWPTIAELSAGFLMAVGLVIAVFFIGIAWTLLTPRDVIDEQTQLSRLIAGSVNTLSLAFVVAISAAVGEEIAYRGALQPIFGLWPTAIFFALTHVQYTLTPATLVIIIVGLGLGWVRKRYNTTAAIITHFAYNFALLFLTIYGSYLQDQLNAGAL